jgi:hypothetical protein
MPLTKVYSLRGRSPEPAFKSGVAPAANRQAEGMPLPEGAFRITGWPEKSIAKKEKVMNLRTVNKMAAA